MKEEALRNNDTTDDDGIVGKRRRRRWRRRSWKTEVLCNGITIMLKQIFLTFGLAKSFLRARRSTLGYCYGHKPAKRASENCGMDKLNDVIIVHISLKRKSSSSPSRPSDGCSVLQSQSVSCVRACIVQTTQTEKHTFIFLLVEFNKVVVPFCTVRGEHWALSTCPFVLSIYVVVVVVVAIAIIINETLNCGPKCSNI